jgi:hypothetical protein
VKTFDARRADQARAGELETPRPAERFTDDREKTSTLAGSSPVKPRGRAYRIAGDESSAKGSS